MKFNRGLDGRKTVTFEIDTANDLHQQSVAVTALGALTAARIRDREARLIPAMLATRINRQDTTVQKDGKDVRVATTSPLPRQEAQVLRQALEQFAEDAPAGILMAQTAGNPYGSNVVAVQAHMAEQMAEELIAEFNLPQPPPVQRFGFR
jgi:hypothetical protein